MGEGFAHLNGSSNFHHQLTEDLIMKDVMALSEMTLHIVCYDSFKTVNTKTNDLVCCPTYYL